MRICVMSDLHGYLPPAHNSAEITLICGDILPLNIQSNINKSKQWLKTEFAYWVLNWPSSKVYFIAGNHDFVFDGHWNSNETAELSLLTEGKAVYLDGQTTKEYIDLEGTIHTIFGTPYCHIFGNWAFMRSDKLLRELYEPMPRYCEIVISHDAADINDMGMVPPNIWHPNESVNAGNKVLAEFIKDRIPKYYFCGHIHDGNHQVTTIDGTTMANTSILDDNYHFHYEPMYLDI